jgi:hypothetical protein
MVSFFVILSKSQCAFRGDYQSPWRCDDMHTLKVIWKFGRSVLSKKCLPSRKIIHRDKRDVT